MKEIVLSKTLSLPPDAVTQTLACIGRKGAGKTYLASVLAEQMLDLGAQVVIIDPVGNWWGLRVGADGKSKGKDIFIAGGERGDVPVLPEAGARFAKLVVEKGVSIVLDVSGFRQGERKRFAADFAEEFFHLKKAQRSVVHLFVEEAQLFAPQRVGPEEARMLGAFENIIRLGRNYGIGATMISQRPQSINKEVLSQVECLCVLQVNGTHERKALEDWVQEAGADRKLVGELPGLSRGEGYVWSPSWLRVFRRVHFSKKTTFDASATPEVGRQAKAAMPSSVDVEALKADLQEVIAKVEKDDPKILRKRIAELERNAAPNEAQSKTIESLAARVQELETYSQSVAKQSDSLKALRQNLKTFVPGLENLMKLIETESTVGTLDLLPSYRIPKPKDFDVKRVQIDAKLASGRIQFHSLGNSNGNLRAGARRMLACLCQWFPSGRTESQVAAQVQMKKTGGTWAAYKSDLTKGGYVQIQNGMWFATDAGRDFLGADIPDTPQTTEEVVKLWGEKLRLGARSMLDALVRSRGRSVSREELGRIVNMEHTGGTFSAYLSDLKQAGLIIVDRDGVAANAETLLL